MKKIIAFLVSIVVAYLCYVPVGMFIELAPSIGITQSFIDKWSSLSMIFGVVIGVGVLYKFVYRQLFERKEFER